MSKSAAGPTITGRIVLPADTSKASHVTLRVVTRSRAGQDHPAVPVQANGSFAIWLPDGDATTVQVLGPTGELLAQQDLARDRDNVEMVIGDGLDAGEQLLLVNPTFADAAGLTSLRVRIDGAVAAGELSATAPGVLDRLQGVLGVLDDLLPDAHRALVGDDAAAQRFRRGLLVVPSLGARPAAPPPIASHRGPGRRWAEFLLTGAVNSIVTDEDDLVELNSALANALEALLQLDLLLSVPAPAAGTLRSVMLALGDDFDGGGFGLDTPGFPGSLGLPGLFKSRKLPTGPSIFDLFDLLSHRPKFHWDRELREFVWDTPIYVEPCILRAIDEMEKLRSNEPHWQVRSISDAAACPGDIVVLSGSGFGSSGVVYFNATGTSTEVPGSTILWTDTSISVRVPAGAHPGPIHLQVPMKSLNMCGGVFPLTRLGSSEVTFEGGLPEIHYLVSHWTNGPVIRPDTDAVIDFGYSAAAGVTADVSVWNGGTRIAAFPSLTGGTHHLTFHAPLSTTSVALRVKATARNACGEDSRSLDLTVGIPPKIAIVGMEVIQAVQRPDPLTTGTGLGSTLRLAARKRTALRVYVTSGLPATFSYEKVLGGISVSGTARIFATAVSPRVAYTALPTAVRLKALEFELPWTMCSGTQQISVTVRPASSAPGLSGYIVNHTITVTFDPQSNLRLIRMRVRDDRYGLPAPTSAQWAASAQGARERYPIAEDGIIVSIAPGWEQFGTDRDLNSEDGWEDLLDDIDDIADDFTDIGQVWTAVVPLSGGYNMSGLAHTPFDRVWPLDDDYRALVVQATLAASCAHEIAHTFGILHSPGGPVKNSDMSLPARLEPDVIGWRASDDMTFPPGSPDLMSYLPINDSRQNRWPSAELWNRLFNRLN